MKEFYEFFNLTTKYCNMKMDADSNWKKYVIKNKLFDDIIRNAIHMNKNVLEWYEKLCKEHEMYTGLNFPEYCFICSTSDCMDNI